MRNTDGFDTVRSARGLDLKEGVAVAVVPLLARRVVRQGEILGGKYTLERHVGAGSMGHVFAGMHTELELPVAVKILTFDPETQPEAEARFRREMRAIARLRSEHAVRVFDVGRTEQGAPYLVMARVFSRRETDNRTGECVDRRTARPNRFELAASSRTWRWRQKRAFRCETFCSLTETTDAIRTPCDEAPQAACWHGVCGNQTARSRVRG